MTDDKICQVTDTENKFEKNDANKNIKQDAESCKIVIVDEILEHANENELENQTEGNIPKQNKPIQPPDQGWGWVVVFACFFSNLVVDGVLFSYGIFTPEFIKHFNISRSNVGFMGSLIIAITCCMAPLSSYLCSKFSYRSVAVFGAFLGGLGFTIPYFSDKIWVLILSNSVLSSIGFGLMYLPSIIIVNVWFEKKRSLALGIAICGSGLGTFIFSPFIEFLIEKYGWQFTMLILSLILYVLIASSMTFKNRNSQEKQAEAVVETPIPVNTSEEEMNETDKFIGDVIDNKPVEKTKLSVKELLKNPIFILFIISNFLTSVGFDTPYMFTKDRALLAGIPTNKASHLIAAIGIGNLIGRLGFGYLATFKGINRFHLYNMTLVSSGVVLSISWFMNNYILMIIYNFIYGIMSGPVMTLSSVILIDLFGLKNLDATLGVILVNQGIGVLIGPPISGWIYDMTLSYNITFFIVGIIIAISGLIMYLAYISRDFRKLKFTI